MSRATFVRVGEGQHLLEHAPLFVVYEHEPVVLRIAEPSGSRVSGRRSSLRPFTTHDPDIDREAVDIDGVEGVAHKSPPRRSVLVVPLLDDTHGVSRPVNRMLVVVSLKWMQERQSADATIRVTNGQLEPGVWVLVEYEDDSPEYVDAPWRYRYELLKQVEVKATREIEFTN